ncbi:lamin tail domain-containing protein [Actinoplanes sp. NPDC026670]|uniref:lamin tail domain-containing protein n=1 Tax=Actinoplanes sp. NPDC026670 TaxID=3154700 RepID=UPI0033FBF88D
MRKLLAALTVTAAGLALTAAPAAAATPTLRFHSTQYDSPGKDTRSNTSLNQEWIALVNTGSTAVNLNGWKIVDKSATYTIGNVTIAGKGGVLYLHTGKGTNTARHLYWGRGNYVWNNTGDTAVLKTKAGRTHDTCAWKQKSGRTRVAC